MTNGMASSGGEPTIAELLSDPIAQTLMRADGITVADVLAWIGRRRRSLERRHPQPPRRRARPGRPWAALMAASAARPRIWAARQ